MPALPWFSLSTAEPDAQVVVMASRLPLRRYRDIPGFLRWTLRIRRQLATTPGVVGYSLDAHLLARTFWTVSAWTGQEAIEAFVATEPHRDAMAAIRPRMRKSTFVFWPSSAADLPVSWKEARDRVSARSRR